MSWTLEKIKKEVRVITGIYKDDISDDKVEEIIQNFWMVSLPALIKPESYKGVHRFLARRGVSTYPHPTNFTSLSPEAYIESSAINVTYDDRIIPTSGGAWNTESFEQGVKPNETTFIRISDYPAIETVCVYTNSHTFFYGDEEIEYLPETKEVAIRLKDEATLQGPITVKYQSAPLDRPRWLLVKDRYLTLSPTPDADYIVEVQGMEKPEPLPYTDNLDHIPQEFCDLIVYGSALKIFSLLDMNGYQKIYPVYKRYEAIAMSKTYQQLLYTDVRGI